MNILIALGIPFIGTTLGAAMVFFMKEKIAPKLEKALLGFASGVMMRQRNGKDSTKCVILR